MNGKPPDLAELLADIHSRRVPSDRKGPTMKQFTDAVMGVCESRAEGRITDAETELLLQRIGSMWAISNFYSLLEELAKVEATRKNNGEWKPGILINFT